MPRGFKVIEIKSSMHCLINAHSGKGGCLFNGLLIRSRRFKQPSHDFLGYTQISLLFSFIQGRGGSSIVKVKRQLARSRYKSPAAIIGQRTLSLTVILL